MINNKVIWMKDTDIIRTCSKHGEGAFMQRRNKTGSVWYVCRSCLKEQWRKAQAKIRLKPENKEYQKDYHSKVTKIQKTLSLYLAMITMLSKPNKDMK